MHFLFAWRYFRGKYSFQAIQWIAWVSVFAIAIGTAALLTILSVSNGFSDIVKGLYADFYADLRVVPKAAKFISLTPEQLSDLRNIPGVRYATGVVENKAILVRNAQQAVVFVKGVDANYVHINQVNQYLKRGSFSVGNLDSPKLVLGIGVEENLLLFNTELGDSLELIAVGRSGKSLRSLDQLNHLVAVQSGAFSVQQEFDAEYVFTSNQFAQYLFDLDSNQYSGVELAIDLEQESTIKAAIQSILGPDFLVQNKYQQNADLYKIMQIEKWIIFAILALIMVVASFNLVGALTMLVLEKQKDIHVLHAMGATAGTIQKIFLSLSIVMSMTGALIGGLIASALIFLQSQFHFIKLQGASFVIDYYPVKAVWTDYLAVIGLVICIAIVAGWIPARKAGARVFEKIG
ncbi:MAG: ABC transporter permease [Sediminibacterium sp.]|nr:ABC transporter permease [Sediminibacterium sp.]MBP6144556.1 ABC transporter permease [Sediminibacterium sp.]